MLSLNSSPKLGEVAAKQTEEYDFLNRSSFILNRSSLLVHRTTHTNLTPTSITPQYHPLPSPLRTLTPSITPYSS